MTTAILKPAMLKPPMLKPAMLKPASRDAADELRETAPSKATIVVDDVDLSVFGLRDTFTAFDGAWHHHDRGQLLYAARGSLNLVVANAQWLLPPQRAAWIPASMRHRTFTNGPVELTTVYLRDKVLLDAPTDVTVFAADELLRAMVMQAAAWGPTGARDPVAHRFLAGLAAMVGRWAASSLSFYLPRAQSIELQRAMDWTQTGLAAAPTLDGAARAAGLSARSLTRRFSAEVGMTWGRYLRTARLLRAMALLEGSDARVTDTAYDVGFENLSAFSRAFREFTGERPRDYRNRVLDLTRPATHR